MSALLPFLDPCIPRQVRQPPRGDEWIHQPKLDGWRCQAVKVGSKVVLYSRHGHDLTRRFPTIAAAVSKLLAKSVTLDGEIVQVGERGIDFYAITGKQTRNGTLMASTSCRWTARTSGRSGWRRDQLSLSLPRHHPATTRDRGPPRESAKSAMARAIFAPPRTEGSMALAKSSSRLQMTRNAEAGARRATAGIEIA